MFYIHLTSHQKQLFSHGFLGWKIARALWVCELSISINEDLTSSISHCLYFLRFLRFGERKSIFCPRNLRSWGASTTTLQASNQIKSRSEKMKLSVKLEIQEKCRHFGRNLTFAHVLVGLIQLLPNLQDTIWNWCFIELDTWH